MEKNWLKEELKETEQVLWQGKGNRCHENNRYYLVSILSVIAIILLPAVFMGKTILKGIQNGDLDSGLMMAAFLFIFGLVGIAQIVKQILIRRKEVLYFAVTNHKILRYTGHGAPDVLPIREIETLRFKKQKNGNLYIELDDFSISGVENTEAVYDLIKSLLTAPETESESEKTKILHKGNQTTAVIDSWLKYRLKPDETILWRGETCRSKNRENMRRFSFAFMLLHCGLLLAFVFGIMSKVPEEEIIIIFPMLVLSGMLLYDFYQLYQYVAVKDGDVCQYVITTKRVYRHHNGWVKKRDIDEIWHPFLREEEGRSGTIKLDRNFYMEHIPDAKRVQQLLIKLSEEDKEK